MIATILAISYHLPASRPVLVKMGIFVKLTKSQQHEYS